MGIRFAVVVKATIDIPDDLYRRVKAKSALEGRAVRDVTVDLFRTYVEQSARDAPRPRTAGQAGLLDGLPAPSWHGVLRRYAGNARRHDMEAIRESIGRGIAREDEA